MASNGADPLIAFDRRERTVTVRDELEGATLRLRIDEPRPIEPAIASLFPVPIDEAVTLTASTLTVDSPGSTVLRDGDGDFLGQFTEEPWTLDRGTYYLQLLGPVTAYLRIEDAAFTGTFRNRESIDSTLELTFRESTAIALGARSHHRRPRATITVPDEPTAAMTAISHLGSSIKEFSAERSWPTLRGHPPALEPGDELAVPASLSKPETGVTIGIPPDLGDVYRVAPLAFYLGADVVEADRPELRLETGYVEPLATERRSIEASVDRLLAAFVLLDSLTRIGGYYSLSRYEYEELAPELPFYPPNLYDASLSRQLMDYLEVSQSILEPYLPRWPQTAVLRPRIQDVEHLPLLLDSLARVHVADSVADHRQRRRRVPNSGDERAAAIEAPPPPATLASYSHSEPPAGSARLLPGSVDRATAHAPPEPDEARFAFVATDADRVAAFRSFVESMTRTDTVPSGALSVVDSPTAAELAHVLEGETTFAFVDLPVSDGGVACADDRLRPAALGSIGTAGFWIRERADPSIGPALVERGALAGATSDPPVSVAFATRLARALFRGISLAESARMAAEAPLASRFVGDAARPIVRCPGGRSAIRIDVETVGPDEHRLRIRPLPDDINRLGSVQRPTNDALGTDYRLVGTPVSRPERYSTADVVSIVDELDGRDCAVLLNGSLCPEPSEEAVRASARRALSTIG